MPATISSEGVGTLSDTTRQQHAIPPSLLGGVGVASDTVVQKHGHTPASNVIYLYRAKVEMGMALTEVEGETLRQNTRS